VAKNYFPVVFQRENLAFPASIRIVLAPVPPKQIVKKTLVIFKNGQKIGFKKVAAIMCEIFFK
jgi:hypothetical protein